MKILVVEDQQKVAEFIVQGLKEELYSVDHVNNGIDADHLLQSFEYDLMVLDIMIPGINGFDLLKKTRNDNNEIPILILSAKTTTEDKIRGLDLGADDYLVKPFSFSEFLARIRALLRRKNDSITPLLTISDLTLNQVTHEVERAGQKIDLTAKEYALLEYLLLNSGRVLSRTNITEHIWDMNFNRDTNLVDVFIRYLRKKIDDNFSPKLIHTARGSGYVLKIKES